MEIDGSEEKSFFIKRYLRKEPDIEFRHPDMQADKERENCSI